MSRPVLILWAGLCLLLTGLMAANTFEGAEWKLLNMGFQKRKPVVKRPEIITIDIDDEAVSRVGRWPWTWEKHAALLNYLAMHKVRSVAFMDMDFSREVPVSLPDEQEMRYRGLLLNSVGRGAASAPLLSLLPDHSGDFYRSLKNGTLTCFSFGFKVPGGGEARQNVLKAAEQNAATQSSGKKEMVRLLKEKIGIPGTPESFPVASDILPLTADILKHSACAGFNTILMDRDGVVRKYPLITYYNGSLYPSAGLQLARQLLAAPDIRIERGNYVELKGSAGKVRIPVNASGEMDINWAGDYRNSFVHLPFNLVSEFVGFQLAKNEARKHPLESLQDPMSLNDMLVESLERTNFLTKEESLRIGSGVFFATLFEHYSIEEVVAALGPDGNKVLEMGRQVFFNNYLANRYRGTGKVPRFEEAVKEMKFQVDEKLKRKLGDSYALMVYYLDNGMIDAVRPLYFEPASELVQGDRRILVTPLLFKDAVVFYGLTATGLAVQNATPFSNLEDMLDMAPNALNTILTGNFIREFPAIASYPVVYGYLLVVLLCATRLSPLLGFLFADAAVSLHAGLAWLLFSGKGYVLPVTAPVSAILLSYLSAVGYRYFEEQRERKKVRGMFSTMVSPEVLKMMEEHSGSFRFSGEQTEATLFSSDVSGFTTISEGVTARELANILNIYLTPMSNIIMSYNGYIDKYEGDAIKADFGVPLHDPDHSWKACFAALYQQEELKVIQRMILLKYGVKITARMGLNTGAVSAGNMGSEKRMQYTVMGEAVTLAEELEPANKIFETWIAIGPATYEQVKDFVEVRYLGNTALGGRHSLPVYELTGWKKEKFMEFWSGKPIPELALESMKKMLPEKVLAYGEFYGKKEAPDSALLADTRKLFEELRGPALDYMRVNNIQSVLFVRTELERLRQELGKHEQLLSGVPLPPHFLNDIAGLERKIAAETEGWNRVLLTWRRDLKEDAAHQFLLRSRIGREESDRFLNIIDVLEKSVECIHKRIAVAAEDDLTGREMSGHLKELVMDKDGSLTMNDTAALSAKAFALENDMNRRLSLFADSLKERALEYHALMADFCTVPEGRRRVFALYDEGYESYVRREWDRALGKLREALKIAPDDGPSLQLIRKIEEVRKNPPPADLWTGEW